MCLLSMKNKYTTLSWSIVLNNRIIIVKSKNCSCRSKVRSYILGRASESIFVHTHDSYHQLKYESNRSEIQNLFRRSNLAAYKIKMKMKTVMMIMWYGRSDWKLCRVLFNHSKYLLHAGHSWSSYHNHWSQVWISTRNGIWCPSRRSSRGDLFEG